MKKIFLILLTLFLICSVAFADVVVPSLLDNKIGTIVFYGSSFLIVLLLAILIVTAFSMVYEKITKKDEAYNKSKQLVGSIPFIIISLIVFVCCCDIIAQTRILYGIAPKAIIVLLVVAQFASIIIAGILRFKQNNKKKSNIVLFLSIIVIFALIIIVMANSPTYNPGGINISYDL